MSDVVTEEDWSVQTVRAERLGRAAARAGQDTDVCPYQHGRSAEETELRQRWHIAYAGAGGLNKALFGWRKRVAAGLRRAWNGPEE